MGFQLCHILDIGHSANDLASPNSVLSYLKGNEVISPTSKGGCKG